MILSETGNVPAGRRRTTITELDSDEVTALAVSALDEMKGEDAVVLDIRDKSSIADAMLVVTGNSQRHVTALAENVRLAAKSAGHPPLGVEGDDRSDWVLVDLGDVIVHVMTAEKRDFYALEKLWSVGADEEIERTMVAPEELADTAL